MNYEKKRKRQSGRQAAINFLNPPKYGNINSHQLKIYERGMQDGVRNTLEQLINDGFLSADDFGHAVIVDKKVD